ncbi:MAG TPA: hypothetical protein EYP35_07585 [Desulfobacterales bacterium]|nr:hypothetical protein [Desulfobacterales bacterium]HIP40055.1 hypothetical protein [Desulfocapsa sulfexigens]
MSIGPTRLVLIRSGKYEFGDIELIRPLHLIGPNNVGKTSLISTLQFLYIDQQQKMHFARDLDQTRKYYFPDPDSYILFECLSPTGFRVLGVHGLGPLKSYKFERFSYMGKLHLADFIDEQQQVRPNKTIRSRLSDREYTLLEPSHLKAALTGLGENRGVRLELLPMRDRGGYERFRKVFSNLLRLTHISQEDLKRFLFEIYETDFQQSVIDLESSYSSKYEQVRLQANKVKDLKRVAGDIDAALSLAKQRDTLRSVLPQLYEKIKEGAESRRRKSDLAKEKIAQKQIQLTTDIADNERTQQEMRRQLQEITEELGVVKENLRKLQQEKEDFSSYFAPTEETAIAQLKKKIGDVTYQLKTSAAEPVRRVTSRIKQNRMELKKQEELLRGVANSAVSYLKQHYSDEEIASVFQLFNHDLLGMTVTKGEIEVLDVDKLKNIFRKILGRIDEQRYLDETVQISLSTSLLPDLQTYSDPVLIAEKIEDLQAELERDQNTLQAAEESEVLQKQNQIDEASLKQLEKRYQEYLEYREKCENEKGWKKELDKQEAHRSWVEDKQIELSKQGMVYQEQERRFRSQRIDIETREEALNKLVRSLPLPDSVWKTEEQLVDFPETVEETIAEYENKSKQEQQKREDLCAKLDAIEAKTYGKIKGKTEEETLDLLYDELDGLSKREEAVEKLWSGLTADLQTAIKSMLKDLETLKSRVANLNRQLSKVSVSNLSRLKLVLAENAQLVPRLKAVSSRNDAPLFAGLQNIDEALEFIGEFLRNSGRIELLQLFELHFEVTIADGTPQRYTKLETIESNGTTITIKVLINLMLLRGLVDEKRDVKIPFYLDEASSLDRENVSSIVEQSVEMGFTPILASPEAMDVADNLYYLKDRKGRLLLENNALVRLRQSHA